MDDDNDDNDNDDNDNDNDDTHPPRIIVRVGMVFRRGQKSEQYLGPQRRGVEIQIQIQILQLSKANRLLTWRR